MKLLVCLTSLIAAAISAANPLEKRTTGGVLICTGPSGTGNCTDDQYELNACHDLPGEFVNNAVTFAPETDNFYCRIQLLACDSVCTSPHGCTQAVVEYDSPQKFNLAGLAPGWDRLITSFNCLEGPSIS